MIVWNEKCKKCKDKCDVMYFVQNFENWTSGNNHIDKFIQNSQLSAHNYGQKALEWIPYNRLYDIKYISDEVYRAKWFDGCIDKWDSKTQNWKRCNKNIVVALKSINNAAYVTSEFIKKV
jgi:hypothetical protein